MSVDAAAKRVSISYGVHELLLTLEENFYKCASELLGDTTSISSAYQTEKNKSTSSSEVEILAKMIETAAENKPLSLLNVIEKITRVVVDTVEKVRCESFQVSTLAKKQQQQDNLKLNASLSPSSTQNFFQTATAGNLIQSTSWSAFFHPQGASPIQLALRENTQEAPGLTLEGTLGESQRSSAVFSGIFSPPPRVTRTANIHEDNGGDDCVDVNQYTLMYPIGKGSQGSVVLGMDRNKGELRAIKIVNRSHLSLNVKNPLKKSERLRAIQRMNREVQIMKKCRHRNIVRLYEIIDDPKANSIYMVLQYIEHGPLVHLQDDGYATHTIPPKVLAGYMQQMTSGLAYLHRKNVVHKDLKPDNILLGANDAVCLADFGVSEVFVGRQQSDDEDSGEGTPAFMAPEQFRHDTLAPVGKTTEEKLKFLKSRIQKGKLGDVWALGLTFYVLLYGKLPWSEVETFADLRACICGSDPIPLPTTAPVYKKCSETGSVVKDGEIVIPHYEKWCNIFHGTLNRSTDHRWSTNRVYSEVRKLVQTMRDNPDDDDIDDEDDWEPEQLRDHSLVPEDLFLLSGDMGLSCSVADPIGEDDLVEEESQASLLSAFTARTDDTESRVGSADFSSSPRGMDDAARLQAALVVGAMTLNQAVLGSSLSRFAPKLPSGPRAQARPSSATRICPPKALPRAPSAEPTLPKCFTSSQLQQDFANAPDTLTHTMEFPAREGWCTNDHGKEENQLKTQKGSPKFASRLKEAQDFAQE